jgi:hypothetical protein
MAVLALSMAFVLSPPEIGAWAWHQSPGSPVSPVSPVSTQPDQLLTPSSTVQVITPTSIPETPVPLDAQPPQSSDRGTALLVAGGIVLVGLIAGAVVLLMRGQPPDESTV